MAGTASPESPHHVLGTNLTWGEVLRLVLLLCLVPWLFTAALFVFRIVPLPKGRPTASHRLHESVLVAPRPSVSGPAWVRPVSVACRR